MSQSYKFCFNHLTACHFTIAVIVISKHFTIISVNLKLFKTDKLYLNILFCELSNNWHNIRNINTKNDSSQPKTNTIYTLQIMLDIRCHLKVWLGRKEN